MSRYRRISDVPKDILDAALQEYSSTTKDVKLICLKYGISHTTLYKLRKGKGIPDRPKHKLFNITLH